MINQIISHQKSNLFLNFANIKGCRSGTCGVLQCNLRRIHTLLMASCSERNLIGWRTETSGDVPPTDAPTKQSGLPPKGVHLSQVHQPSKQGYIPTEYAEPSGRDVPPTDRHRCAQIRRVWHPAIPTPPITQPNHLWKSVKSVGEYYHAHKQADGESIPTEYAEHTEHSGREVPPTDRHGCAQIRSN